ncbi:MAG: hypothetical protein H7Y20_06065 [Bryobacteraceae bacterium]|nr:hypothetical protein [Bryobacteraceae bacterium]
MQCIGKLLLKQHEFPFAGVASVEIRFVDLRPNIVRAPEGSPAAPDCEQIVLLASNRFGKTDAMMGSLMARGIGSTTWLSFHVFAGGCADEFLIHHVSPYLQRASTDVKRFFFIRHTTDGLHLRLRFLPRAASSINTIRAGMDELVQAFNLSQTAGCPYLLSEKRYDRSEFYFGETLASVYAELLNEQTSHLALRILSQQPDRRGRLLHTLAVVLTMCRGRSPHAGLDWRSMVDSLRLVAGALAKAGLSTADLPALDAAMVARFERRVSELSAGFEADERAIRCKRLLRRADRLSGRMEAGTHAIHLFCNKVGYTLIEEHRLFHLLRAIAATAD